MASNSSDDCSDDHSHDLSNNSSEHMSDCLSLDLEDEDDDVINLNKTVVDKFLNELCSVNATDGVEFDMNEENYNIGDRIIQKGVQYPIHDLNIFIDICLHFIFFIEDIIRCATTSIARRHPTIFNFKWRRPSEGLQESQVVASPPEINNANEE